MPQPRLRRSEVVGYSIGSFGTGGFGTVPGLLLLFYLTDTLGVAASLAGVIVFIPKLWDVLIDPVLGSLSDRTMLRRGSRRPWLLLGGATLPVAFVLTFAAPSGAEPAGTGTWVAIFFVLAVTAFSIFQVSYLAMPAEITDDYAERIDIMSWRIVFLTVAILLFGVAAPLLVDVGGGGRSGYLTMALVVGTLMGLAMIGAWWGTRTTTAHSVPEQGATVREQVAALRENRDFATLLGAFVLQALATGTMLAGAVYVATYLLGDETLTSVLFACLVGPAVLVMPAWRLIGLRLGKQRGFLLATLVFLVAVVALVFLRSYPPVLVYVVVGLVGVAYAGMQMFPLAMLPDTLAADAARSGRQRAGVFTGIWTAGETTGFALGPAIVAAVLAVTGFVSSTAGETASQPDTALTGILLAFSAVPAVLALLSVPLVLRYALSADRLSALLRTPTTERLPS
jgi:GPH family glycoside/pentoside/hexuronide:cation symporter